MSVQSILNTAWGVIPHFQSRNIPRSIIYYTEVLHWSLGGTDLEPGDKSQEPNMCSVAINGGIKGANIYIFNCPPEKELHSSTVMVALGTEAVDEYYRLLKSEGKAMIAEDIEDKKWGYRQFAVKDEDENVIQFFRFLEGGNPGGGELHESKK